MLGKELGTISSSYYLAKRGYALTSPRSALRFHLSPWCNLCQTDRPGCSYPSQRTRWGSDQKTHTVSLYYLNTESPLGHEGWATGSCWPLWRQLAEKAEGRLQQQLFCFRCHLMAVFPHVNTYFGQVTGQTGEMEVLLLAAHQPPYDGAHLGDYLEVIYSFILHTAKCLVRRKWGWMKYLDRRDRGSL